MCTIKTKDGTQIYYKDWGNGQPVVFSHGWPLSADAWDAQMLFLAQKGYRGLRMTAVVMDARNRLGTAIRWTNMRMISPILSTR